MYQSITCIALRTIKYDDRRSIVAAWSDSLGRVSLSMPAGDGREARRRRAMLMPLSVFHAQADVRPGRDILSVRDMRPALVAHSTTSDPTKAVVAMFLSEVLDHTLRTNVPDPALTQYLIDAITWLDATDSSRVVANFPVVFLLGLARHLGISPDPAEWRRGRVLDLRDGVFRATPPTHGVALDPEATRVAALMCRMAPEAAAGLALRRDTRRTILDIIMRYISIHHASLETMHSTTIVSEIF